MPKLETFFSNHDSGAIVCNLRTIAITKKEHSYFLFNSHSNDSDGCSTPDGKAILMRFTSIEELANTILKNVPNGGVNE